MGENNANSHDCANPWGPCDHPSHGEPDHAARVAEMEAGTRLRIAEIAGLKAGIALWKDRAEKAEAALTLVRTESIEQRREAAKLRALLVRALPHVDADAEASHLTDGFNRQPPNATDMLAAAIKAALKDTP